MFRRLTKKFFIWTNLLIALAFLIGMYGGKWQSSFTWVTGFFTLAAPFLLLFLIAFLFFWLFIKPKYIFISILAIAMAWSPLKHAIALRMAPNFVFKKHPSHLRVMSWNVEHFQILNHKKHPELKTEMLDMIAQYAPDVACFQEMVGSDSVPKAINYLPYIKEHINMPYYHYSYNRVLDFDRDHHFGIITFSRYPIIQQHTISYAPKDYNSIFQYVDILKGSDTFRVFNIHLQSLRFSQDNIKMIEDPSFSKDNKIATSKSIIGKLKGGFEKRMFQSNRIRKEMEKSPYPAIVCGDFNDVPNSYAYNTIGNGLKNAFTEKGTGLGRTFYEVSPTLRIDNIFVDQKFSVEQYVRIKKKLSDHYPIIADLFYEKK